MAADPIEFGLYLVLGVCFAAAWCRGRRTFWDPSDRCPDPHDRAHPVRAARGVWGLSIRRRPRLALVLRVPVAKRWLGLARPS